MLAGGRRPLAGAGKAHGVAITCLGVRETARKLPNRRWIEQTAGVDTARKGNYRTGRSALCFLPLAVFAAPGLAVSRPMEYSWPVSGPDWARPGRLWTFAPAARHSCRCSSVSAQL